MVPKICSDAECETELGKAGRAGLCAWHYLQTRPKCSIADCDRPTKGRGMCGAHWVKWRKYGDPLCVNTRRPASRCIIEACGAVMHAHGYCASHLYHYETYGDPLAEGPGRHSGRKRMEVPSYDGMHKRLFYDKGKASNHACIECGAGAKEWSYDGGCPNEIFEVLIKEPVPYTTDQSKYSPRCIRCHRTKDRSLHRGRDKAGRFASGPAMV